METREEKMSLTSINNRIVSTTVSGIKPKHRSSHGKIINEHASHLPKEKRESIIETVRSLQSAGESVEEIQYVIDHFFEDNGITPPSQLVNVRSLRDKGIISKIDAVDLNKILDRVSEMKMEEKTVDEIRDEIESILKELGIKITSNTSVFIDILT